GIQSQGGLEAAFPVAFEFSKLGHSSWPRWRVRTQRREKKSRQQPLDSETGDRMEVGGGGGGEWLAALA
ncbi:MAG: hypothetical protein ACK6DZ_17635, partial [Acidobacteriota bacterium]